MQTLLAKLEMEGPVNVLHCQSTSWLGVTAARLNNGTGIHKEMSREMGLIKVENEISLGCACFLQDVAEHAPVNSV